MKSDRFIHNWFMHLSFFIIIIFFFIASYYKTLEWMYDRYISPDSYYSHGFLIPFITGFLIWMKRDKLKEVNVEFSMWGFFIIILAAATHLLGIILYVFFISGFSIFLLIIGVSIFLWGKEINKIISFPLVFLLFMLPLPLALITAISFPMKMLVAKTGVDFVSILGIPVYREGFYIFIPAGKLLVGNPCSGLRSLIAFLSLGAVMAHSSDLSIHRKWLLFLSAIPIAIISNVVRVFMLILISHFWGLDAAAPETIWHDATGIFVFVIGLLLLISFGRIFKWVNIKFAT